MVTKCIRPRKKPKLSERINLQNNGEVGIDQTATIGKPLGAKLVNRCGTIRAYPIGKTIIDIYNRMRNLQSV
jgi:hypothetical protein